jgi:hypothetical protein
MTMSIEHVTQAASTPGTSLCAVCGQQVAASTGLCGQHIAAEVGWAAANRIMCDFVHRQIAPPRLDAAERLSDLVPPLPGRAADAGILGAAEAR